MLSQYCANNLLVCLESKLFHKAPICEDETSFNIEAPLSFPRRDTKIIQKLSVYRCNDFSYWQGKLFRPNRIQNFSKWSLSKVCYCLILVNQTDLRKSLDLEELASKHRQNKVSVFVFAHTHTSSSLLPVWCLTNKDKIQSFLGWNHCNWSWTQGSNFP